MKRLIAMLACLALVGICRADDPAPSERPAILVLPFKIISDDPHRSWIGDALRENFQAEVLRTRAADLVSPAGRAAAPDNADAALKAADDAKATVVLFGVCQINDLDLRITAQLLDVATGKSLGSLKANGALRQLFDLEDKLTLQLLDVLGQGLEPAPQGLSRDTGPQYSPLLDEPGAFSPVYSYPSYAFDPGYCAYDPAYVSWYPYYSYVPCFFGVSFVEFRHFHHGDHDSHHGEHHHPGHPGHHDPGIPVVRPRPTHRGGGDVVVNRPAPTSILVSDPGHRWPLSSKPGPVRTYEPWPKPAPAAVARKVEPLRQHRITTIRQDVPAYEPTHREVPIASEGRHSGRIDRPARANARDDAPRRATVISPPADRESFQRGPVQDRPSRSSETPRSSLPAARSVEPARSSSPPPSRSIEPSRSSSPASSSRGDSGGGGGGGGGRHR